MASKLKLEWSPVQIAGWLKRIHPANKNNQLSHETIYRSLYIHARADTGVFVEGEDYIMWIIPCR